MAVDGGGFWRGVWVSQVVPPNLVIARCRVLYGRDTGWNRTAGTRHGILMQRNAAIAIAMRGLVRIVLNASRSRTASNSH